MQHLEVLAELAPAPVEEQERAEASADLCWEGEGRGRPPQSALELPSREERAACPLGWQKRV